MNKADGGWLLFLLVVLVVGAVDGGIGKFPGGPKKRGGKKGGGGWSIS